MAQICFEKSAPGVLCPKTDDIPTTTDRTPVIIDKAVFDVRIRIEKGTQNWFNHQSMSSKA